MQMNSSKPIAIFSFSLKVIFCCILFAWFPSMACTVFNKSANGKVLFGNVENENPTYISEFHFVPPNETLGKYGSFYIQGSNGYIGGGMNDQGLCFDVASYPSHPGYNGKPHGDLMKYLLEDCATIPEALSFFNQYYWPGHCCNHIMIMDKTGASVVVELIYGVIYVYTKDAESQVITNYSIRDPEIRYGDFPCPRFQLASAQLDTAAITVDNFQKISESVHNAYYNALFATVYDPLELNIHFFNPNISGSERFTFNLDEEMNKGSHFYTVKNCQIVSGIQENNFNAYSISQNQPNPFSTGTRFTLSVFKPSDVKISVLNLHGKQLSTIANKSMKPGEHEFSWDGSQFPSGIYICRMNINGIIETRKWVKK